MARTPKPVPIPVTAEDEVVLPPKPWTTRGKAVAITANGLKVVRILAASGSGQRGIANKLGMPLQTFQHLMERDERCRLEYEGGLADEERILVRGLRLAAAGGAFIPAMFLLKSRHGYVEGAPPPSTAPNILVVLPQARTPEDYLRDLQARESVKALPAPQPQQVEVIEVTPAPHPKVVSR
jgi:hypothetical protein